MQLVDDLSTTCQGMVPVPQTPRMPGSYIQGWVGERGQWDKPCASSLEVLFTLCSL